VVQFFFNDLADNVEGKSGRRPLFQLDGDRLVPPAGTPAPLTGAARQWLKDHSRTFLFLDYTTRALGGGNDAAAPLAPAADTGAAIDPRAVPGGALTARLLEAIVQTASAAGARVAVLYTPHRLELESPDSVPPIVRAALRSPRVAARTHAVWIDPTAALAAAVARGDTVLFAGDEHWTPAGHAAVAAGLLDSGSVRGPRMDTDGHR
jgi:hypothetical protein